MTVTATDVWRRATYDPDLRDELVLVPPDGHDVITVESAEGRPVRVLVRRWSNKPAQIVQIDRRELFVTFAYLFDGATSDAEVEARVLDFANAYGFLSGVKVAEGPGAAATGISGEAIEDWRKKASGLRWYVEAWLACKERNAQRALELLHEPIESVPTQHATEDNATSVLGRIVGEKLRGVPVDMSYPYDPATGRWTPQFAGTVMVATTVLLEILQDQYRAAVREGVDVIRCAGCARPMLVASGAHTKRAKYHSAPCKARAFRQKDSAAAR